MLSPAPPTRLRLLQVLAAGSHLQPLRGDLEDGRWGWGPQHPSAPSERLQGLGTAQPFCLVENPDSSVFPLSQFGTKSQNFNF